MKEKNNKVNLTPMQKKVVFERGTEPPFNNAYWKHKAKGIYVDVVSGKPLFSSRYKFDSGTGWPSFSEPISKEEIVENTDSSYGMTRIEVRGKSGDTHLGHVFEDGPAPNYKRYCINSASVRFIPIEDMQKEGYRNYLYLFPEYLKENYETESAILAAGCFWGVEAYYRRVKGVIDVKVGYTGGNTANPNYREVCSGDTGHAEAVLVEFDPEIISYAEILDHFWRMHDPTQLNRQGNDIGSQYRSVIFYKNDRQKKEAEKSKKELEESVKYKNKVVTDIVEAVTFYPAEEYHQNHLAKNPSGYCHVNLELAKK